MTLLISLLASIAFARDIQLFQTGVMVERGIHNPFNKGIGQPLDLSERRPIVTLDGSPFESFYGSDPSTTLVANIFHDHRFWIARIPRSGVQSTYFLRSFFMPMVAHSLIRFQMADESPIQLLAEVPTQANAEALQFLPPRPDPILLRNVVVTAEAQWRVNDPYKAYNLVRGAMGQFVQITRVVSMEERFRNYYLTGNRTYMQKINWTPEESSSALLYAFQRSESDGINTYYNTFYYNCATTALSILERVQRAPDGFCGRVAMALGRNLLLSDFIPYLTGLYGLHARGFRPGPSTPMELDPALQAEAVEAWHHLPFKEFTESPYPLKKKIQIVKSLVERHPELAQGECGLLLAGAD
jgi:hypothetical protein